MGFVRYRKPSPGHCQTTPNRPPIKSCSLRRHNLLLAQKNRPSPSTSAVSNKESPVCKNGHVYRKLLPPVERLRVQCLGRLSGPPGRLRLLRRDARVRRWPLFQGPPSPQSDTFSLFIDLQADASGSSQILSTPTPLHLPQGRIFLRSLSRPRLHVPWRSQCGSRRPQLLPSRSRRASDQGADPERRW